MLKVIREFAEKHRTLHRCYWHAAVWIYVAHAIVNLHHGFEIDSTVTALCAVVELIGHMGESA